MPYTYSDMASTVAVILGNTVASPERVGITTPASLTGLLPFIRATRSGGPRDRVNDYARINIDVLDDQYVRGFTLAEQIAEMMRVGRLRAGPVLIDRAQVDSAPQEVAPWAPGIYRIETRYTIISRRHRAA